MQDENRTSSDEPPSEPNQTGNSPQDTAGVSEPKEANSTIAVVAAIFADIAVGVVKFIAAFISGSSAMLSEGIHSIVDSGNAILVLYGIRQSRKGADEDHPFGHGKELYFWTLVVAVLIFAVGGGISLVQGIVYISRITPETQLADPTMNIIVILVAACLEGSALTIAIKQFNRARGHMSPLQFFSYCKDPSLYTVVLEDTVAETGLLFALIGIVLSHVLGNPYFDGVASILISILLMVVAVFLLVETKKLLVGEGLNKPETREVVEIVESNPWVIDCGRVLSMYMGPKQLLITIDANFSLGASAYDILKAVDSIEANIKAAFPDATRVFIEVESLKQVRAQAQAFEAMESDDEEMWEELEAEEAADEEKKKAERDIDEYDAASSEDDKGAGRFEEDTDDFEET